ncbi:acyl-CoA carboxylase subunit epsilon [Streptomyces sp. CC208A]|uniref:acyl-CoA carboxylase subunit epsilon n=1 Tax=Streptomyces sp. CC208A TaxID=3044573 RepID=UPI0024A7E046|nr:acyl-CoA carboxylase subunit epsilon [Streptomyces sp. CC208A]
MGDSDTAPTFRVEHGRASDEELAAVAVVLCSLLAGRNGENGENGENGDAQSPEIPLWEAGRTDAVYRSPYSWR